MSGEPSLTTHILQSLEGPPGSIYKRVCVLPRDLTREDCECSREFMTAETIGVAAKSVSSLPLSLSLAFWETALRVKCCTSSQASYHTCCVSINPTAPSAVEKYTRRQLDTAHGTRLQSRSKSFSATPTSTQEDVAGAAAGAVYV
jgi:hypothetical protein